MLSVLILIQTVSKGYQQTTYAGNELSGMLPYIPVNTCFHVMLLVSIYRGAI